MIQRRCEGDEHNRPGPGMSRSPTRKDQMRLQQSYRYPIRGIFYRCATGKKASSIKKVWGQPAWFLLISVPAKSGSVPNDTSFMMVGVSLEETRPTRRMFGRSFHSFCSIMGVFERRMAATVASSTAFWAWRIAYSALGWHLKMEKRGDLVAADARLESLRLVRAERDKGADIHTAANWSAAMQGSLG